MTSPTAPATPSPATRDEPERLAARMCERRMVRAADAGKSALALAFAAVAVSLRALSQETSRG